MTEPQQITDNTMRDKIAEIISAGFMQHEPCASISDAILAALPSMVKPLVWEGIEYDCFVSCDLLGKSYQLVVCDTLERSCDYNWAATVIIDGKETSVKTPAQASFAEAKAAVHAHNVAAGMAIFGVTTIERTIK